jgi:GT2 family glycosyltransferase/SAM-dependent methyltransferase
LVNEFQPPRLLISGSSQRCGSTWVQRIVHAATDIFIWGESSPLVESLYAIFRAFQETNLVRSQETQNLLSSSQDPTVWRANANPSPAELKRGFSALFSEFYRETYGRTGYGWKEVHYGRKELEFLWELFPELKVVLLVRNPMDVVRSLKAKGWLGRWRDTQSVSWVCRNWSQRTKDYLLLQDHPHTFFVRYEDVASRLEELVEFVGGRMTADVQRALNAVAGNAKERAQLSAEEGRVVLKWCADEMKILNYLDAEQTTALERPTKPIRLIPTDLASEQEKWDHYYANLPLAEEDEATERFNQEFVEHISQILPTGGQVLEAGCGGGWQSVALARLEKFSVHLMDFSDAALMYARRVFQQENLAAQFWYGNVFEAGTPQYDLVFNAGVLEHYTFEQQVAFLRGMASRSKKYVLVLVPNRQCYWYWLWRIHQSIQGAWPFGKEVPLVDLSQVFQAAGLGFVGQVFLGEAWTESFINNFSDINSELRAQILEIHRSPLIPKAHKSYLVAALGSVSPITELPPSIWTHPPESESLQIAELGAALADALALRINAERKLKELDEFKIQLAERDQHINTLHAQIAEKQGELQNILARLNASEQTNQKLLASTEEQAQTLQALTAQIADHKQIVQSLSAQLTESQTSASVSSAELLDQKRMVQNLATQLEEKDKALQHLNYILNTIYGSKLWKYATIYRAIVKRIQTIFKHATLVSVQATAVPQSMPLVAPTESVTTPSEISVPGQTALKMVEKTIEIPMADKYDVFCFPIIDWNFRFQRPQQILTQFAREGHRVFYLRSTFNGLERPLSIQPLGEQIYELVLPGDTSTFIYRDELTGTTLEQATAALYDFIRMHDVAEAICLVHHPFWTPLVQVLKERYGWKVLYDCMDDHSSFQTTPPTIVTLEETLIRISDLVTVSSRLLYQRVSAKHSKCVLIPNAGDFAHSSQLPPRDASPLAHLPRPVIGYYGAIAEWFDVEAVREAAIRHPDWSFVLIGHTFGSDLRKFTGLANIHLLGEKPYHELPALLAGMDVCTIPFLRTPLTEATNPVKVFEYLGAGKPVVARQLPELEALTQVVRLYATPAEFVEQLERAVQEHAPVQIRQRQSIARANTWEQRYQVFQQSVNALYGKAAIIIVTWNNLVLTRQCVDSVLRDETYPQFELILVDNASSDGTSEYLRALAEQNPRVHVILNEQNLGFAAANNLALRAAHDSEFIVLLNNDTVVPRGWLARLLRYARQPEIGLVGPVTNWSGNESRIEVPYTDLTDMESFARAYVASHEGQVLDLRTLAMFCVAMRRTVAEQIGPLDERFGIGMFEDDDYARRVRQAGYRVICAEDVFVHHHGSASFSKLGQNEYRGLFELNKRLYEEKWGEPWVPHRNRYAADSPM